MDAKTSKNLISRIRQSDLDEEEQEEAIAMVKRERRESKPSVYLNVSGPEDGEMGGQAKVILGETTTVEVRPPEEWVEDMGLDDEEDYVSMTVDLSLNRIGDTLAFDDGEGGPPGSDEWILADYDLTYGQAKDLLRLLEPLDEGVRVGTPGDVETELRRLLGDPSNLNRWIREVQLNGVRGWRNL